MAAETTAQLTTRITNLDMSNGSNGIDGAGLETLLQNLVDSVVNNSSDTTGIVTEAIRTGVKTLSATTNIAITFSSTLGTTDYKVYFANPDSVLDVAADAHTLTATGFQVDGTGVGDIRYFAVLNT